MANLNWPASSNTGGKNAAGGAGKHIRVRKLPGAYMLIIGVVIGALVFGGGIAIAGSAFLAEPATSRVYVDGKEVSVEAYQIEDTNYFKLRDFAQAVDVGVWYDEDRDRVYIETDIGYDPKYTGVREEPKITLTPLQKSISVEIDNKKQFDIGLSETQSFSATFTIVELKRGEEAADIVKTASVYNPSAGIGKEYILAWVRAKITDSKDKKNVVLSDIRVNMHCYSMDEVLYPVSNPANINPVNEQPKGIGETVEGWVAFVVDKNDPEPRIQFGALAGTSEPAWFTLYD